MSSDICEPLVEDVRLIIETSLSDAQVQAMIDDAALLVSACVESLECARQTAIIKWVTAHLIANLSTATSGGAGVVTQESLGDASISYAKPPLLGEGLKSTTYGQQAIALDPNGCIASLGRNQAKVFLLGRNPSNRNSYDERND